jgi:hypothetical protein
VKKELKIIALFLLGAFLIIQFIPSGLPGNNPAEGFDLVTRNNVHPEIATILRSACYDCHSQEVKFPWYSYVAPVSWQVAKDINNGREHLDFSNWEQLSKRKKVKMLAEISEVVGSGEMPLRIYKVTHSDANLSSEQRQQIVDWADNLAEKIMEK